MHVAFVAASRGFHLQFAEYDVTMCETVVFRFLVYWKKPFPVRAWSMHRCDSGARFAFETYRKGKWTGWRFRGPIERVERA